MTMGQEPSAVGLLAVHGDTTSSAIKVSKRASVPALIASIQVE
ncbi:MAG TPA: hypothetical protein VKB80_32775 [Kofleriaceae bacterium]|nr:hypothetical protein [Kofleriaceae bacterium]